MNENKICLQWKGFTGPKSRTVVWDLRSFPERGRIPSFETPKDLHGILDDLPVELSALLDEMFPHI